MNHLFILSMRGIKLVLVTLLMCSLSISAFAAKPEKCEDWPACKNDGGGDDPLSLPYIVEIIDHLDFGETSNSPLFNPGDRADPIDPDVFCLAEAHDHMSNFNGTFYGKECAYLNYLEDGTGSISSIDKILGFHVTRDKKTGEIISVWLEGRGIVGDEVFAYVSEEILNAPVASPPPGGAFYIHLHRDNVKLMKCVTFRNIRKAVCDQLVGTFAIADMWYRPNP